MRKKLKINTDNQGPGKHKPPYSAPFCCSSARYDSLLFNFALQWRTCSSALWRVNVKFSHSTHTLSKEDLFHGFLTRKQDITSIHKLLCTATGRWFTPLLQYTWTGQTLLSQTYVGNGRERYLKEHLLMALHKLGASMLFSMEVILSWRRKTEKFPQFSPPGTAKLGGHWFRWFLINIVL